MKVISKDTIRKTCDCCDSLVEIFRYDMKRVSQLGPYNLDYETEEIGKMYWQCPVCGKSKWIEMD